MIDRQKFAYSCNSASAWVVEKFGELAMQSPDDHRETAIFCADVPGYNSRQVFSDKFREYEGRVVSDSGDSILAEFKSVADAVNCAVALREELAGRGQPLPRIGVARGETAFSGNTISGRGVIKAERLRVQCEPGGLQISPMSSVTLRIGKRGIPPGGKSRTYIMAAGVLQMGLLLSYFLLWYGLISWKTITIAVHGQFPCRPEWLCDKNTPSLQSQMSAGDGFKDPPPNQYLSEIARR